MTSPLINFACELDTRALQALLTDQTVIADLQALQASLTLGIFDYSPERAQVVRQLNQEGILVVAWLLLPIEQGYWFHQENAIQALARYRDFKSWTEENNLNWDGVRLDIQPDIHEMQRWLVEKWRTIPYMLKRSFKWKTFRSARRIFRYLINEVHSDGYRVDIYQYPFIIDERKAESTLIQRATGILDLPADREVLMLYSSFVRPHGAGFLWSYAPEAQCISIGTTGSDIGSKPSLDPTPLSLDEFDRDLRLAWNWTNNLFIYNLEGCVKQGYLHHLRSFEWDRPIIAPVESALRVENWRNLLQTTLWISTHLWLVALGIFGLVLLFIPLRRKK